MFFGKGDEQLALLMLILWYVGRTRRADTFPAAFLEGTLEGEKKTTHNGKVAGRALIQALRCTSVKPPCPPTSFLPRFLPSLLPVRPLASPVLLLPFCEVSGRQQNYC